MLEDHKTYASIVAKMFYQAAAILQSGYMCMFLLRQDYSLKNVDASRMNKNLIALLGNDLKPVLGCNFESTLSQSFKVSTAFRKQAERMNNHFKLGLEVPERDFATLLSLEEAAFSLAEEFCQHEDDLNFYKVIFAGVDPVYYAICFKALQAFAYFSFAKKTLQNTTCDPVFDSFLSSLKSSYLSGENYQYIHSILVKAVNWLRSNKLSGGRPIFQFSTLYPRADLSETSEPKSLFVTLDCSTGQTFGHVKPLLA